MSNEETDRSDEDAELQREIRKERTFSLSEAIGRLAGPGCMKGASPVARTRQAELEIDDYLRRRLPEVAGDLRLVLLRHVERSEIFLNNIDWPPLVVLAACIQQTLN